MPRDSATLLDIARAARLVLDFTSGMDQGAFIKDLRTQSAVLINLWLLVKPLEDFHEPSEKVTLKCPGH